MRTVLYTRTKAREMLAVLVAAAFGLKAEPRIITRQDQFREVCREDTIDVIFLGKDVSSRLIRAPADLRGNFRGAIIAFLDKSEDGAFPILMEYGVDHVLPPPVAPRKQAALIARIRAILRRAKPEALA